MERKPWDIFGTAIVPCITGDSKKDAGLYIGRLIDNRKELVGLLEVHCNLCLVQKLMFGNEEQARKACKGCSTFQWTNGPKTEDIVAEMFKGDKAPVKPNIPDKQKKDPESLADIVAEELMMHGRGRLDDNSRFMMEIIEREVDKKIKVAQCQCPIE